MKTINSFAFSPITGTKAKEPTSRRQATKWVPLCPVPDHVKAPKITHYKHGKPVLVHEYRDAGGGLLGFVCRFDRGPDGKLFQPLTWCRDSRTGKEDWRWKAWQAPRPLYGLDRLAAPPVAPVIIVEGEKAADAAARLLPGHVAITSPNGSKSALKADWRPLTGRDVIIWPDHDEPGQLYAKDVITALWDLESPRATISIVTPPADKPKGWDAADALAENWIESQDADQ